MSAWSVAVMCGVAFASVLGGYFLGRRVDVIEKFDDWLADQCGPEPEHLWQKVCLYPLLLFRFPLTVPAATWRYWRTGDVRPRTSR